jgi:ParB-like chromosome segregation protein Spo0J
MTTATIPESIVERRPLAWLREHPHNPRGPVVDDESLRELADSIAAQGILQPLVATPDGTLLAGHRRAAAAQDCSGSD